MHGTAAMKAKRATMAVVELRGRHGLWRLEATCGQCGCGELFETSADRSEKVLVATMNRHKLCDGVYHGKPGNRCNWPLSFAYVFVPLVGESN